MEKVYKILVWKISDLRCIWCHFVPFDGIEEFSKEEAEANIASLGDNEEYKNCYLEVKEFYRQKK